MFFFCVYYSIIFWNGMISKNTAMKELGKQNLVISAVRKAFHTFFCDTFLLLAEKSCPWKVNFKTKRFIKIKKNSKKINILNFLLKNGQYL